MEKTNNYDRLIDAKEFAEILCCGMTTFNNKWQTRNDFPKPLPHYDQKRVWRLSAAMDYLDYLETASANTTGAAQGAAQNHQAM